MLLAAKVGFLGELSKQLKDGVFHDDLVRQYGEPSSQIYKICCVVFYIIVHHKIYYACIHVCALGHNAFVLQLLLY